MLLLFMSLVHHLVHKAWAIKREEKLCLFALLEAGPDALSTIFDYVKITADVSPLSALGTPSGISTALRRGSSAHSARHIQLSGG